MTTNDKHFRNSRKKDLTDFLGILSSYSISYTSINHKENLSNNFWGYNIKALSLPVENSTLKHIRPEGITNAQLIIDIDLESKVGEWLNLNDPFTSLNFRALIKGANALTKGNHYLGFHIERHNGASNPNEIHPLYHLQYLQNPKSKPKDEFNHGDSLQLDIPRMMHFPMELILGTSFLLSNFAPVLYSKLLQNRQYIALCRVYQERIWRPYINSIESFWDVKNPAQRTWDPRENCPYLL